jgi:hypothetical protein
VDSRSPNAPVTFTHAIALLDTMPGIDMARFSTASRLTVWAGVAPGNDASAGKQQSGRTRPENHPLLTVLTQLAHAAARTLGDLPFGFIPPSGGLPGAETVHACGRALDGRHCLSHALPE